MTVKEVGEAKSLFLLLLFNIALTLSTMVFRAVINAHEKFLFLKGAETVELVLQPLLVILVLWQYPNAFSVAMVQTLMNIILIFVRGYYCFEKLGIRIRFHYWDSKLIHEFKKLALSVFAISLVDQVFFKTNQVILGIVSGTFAVAVYSIASLIYINYMALSNAISGVYLPHITEMVAGKEPVQKLSGLFIQIGRWQYWITLLIIIPFTIDLIQNIGLSILQAQNHYDFRAKVYFGIGILNLILAIPLGMKYGGIGCAFATGFSMFIGNGLVMNWYYSSVTGLQIKEFWKQIIKISFRIVFCCIIGYFINIMTMSGSNMVFVIKMISYTILYSGVIYFTSMNREEKNKICQLLRREM